MYPGDVAKNIQIRNVPDDVHEVYKRRAAAAGQSLQEYLLANLTDGASRLSMQEAMERIASRDRTGSTVTIQDVVAALRKDRDSH
jgi:antitoxin FitA